MLRFGYDRIVHWGECDAAQIIFFANYFRWMDEGYGLMMRSAGIDVARLSGQADMHGTPTVAITSRFASPARLGDEVRHTLEVVEIRTRSFTLSHRFERQGTLLAEAQDSRVWAAIALRPPFRLQAVAVPPEVRALLAGE